MSTKKLKKLDNIYRRHKVKGGCNCWYCMPGYRAEMFRRKKQALLDQW